ncbi:MAG: hypothetical protein GY812_16325 [Actinomycetia bacterium]|nr:hypothetical protein [Actinomycetes bacterium]
MSGHACLVDFFVCGTVCIDDNIDDSTDGSCDGRIGSASFRVAAHGGSHVRLAGGIIVYGNMRTTERIRANRWDKMRCTFQERVRAVLCTVPHGHPLRHPVGQQLQTSENSLTSNTYAHDYGATNSRPARSSDTSDSAGPECSRDVSTNDSSSDASIGSVSIHACPLDGDVRAEGSTDVPVDARTDASTDDSSDTSTSSASGRPHHAGTKAKVTGSSDVRPDTHPDVNSEASTDDSSDASTASVTTHARAYAGTHARVAASIYANSAVCIDARIHGSIVHSFDTSTASGSTHAHAYAGTNVDTSTNAGTERSRDVIADDNSHANPARFSTP